MKMVFDMRTGEIIEGCQVHQNQKYHGIADSYALPELRMQEITNNFREEKRILPELVIADLNAFLAKMS